MENQSKDIFGYSYQVFKTKNLWRVDIYQNKKPFKSEYKETALLCLLYALEFERLNVFTNEVKEND